MKGFKEDPFVFLTDEDEHWSSIKCVEAFSPSKTGLKHFLYILFLMNKFLIIIIRASDISCGRGPANFRFFREIPRNSQNNAKYREIRQKYFQIHVGKTYLILILAIRPVFFTPNVQIYLETSSLQRVKKFPKLTGVFRSTLRKTGH